MAKKQPPSPESPPSRPEEYTVLARRYRPQQFNELVGQEPVARALTNALKMNRVAHAYLFTGARGVGKTSCARILAKALNCLNGPTPQPCDQCDVCRSISTGEGDDVQEIDAASNRGIDDIRLLRQNVGTRPSRSRYKVYIIDEVHMLTKEAFNALLKTLEEPPPHVKFIFATTDVQKIPITILSRCQRFDFAGIGTPGIVERLREIVQQEKKEADDEALEMIARRAGGSMRDAQSLLDLLLAFGDERLTTNQVHQLLGTAQDERVIAIASAITEHDAKRALDLFGQAVDEGGQLGEFLDQLIAYWRDMMVVHCAGTNARGLSVSSRHHETLAQHAAGWKLDSILAGLDILVSAKARMRGSNHGRTLVEMALVRLGRLEDLIALPQLVQWLGQGKSDAGTRSSAMAPAVAAAGARPRLAEMAKPADPPEALKKKVVASSEPPAASTGPVLTEHTLPQIWQELLAQLGPMTAGEVQKAGLPAITGPNTLALQFGAQYNHEYEFCQDPTRLARIEETLSKLAGQKCQVRVEAAGGVPITGSNDAAGEILVSSPRSRRQRNEAVEEPLFRRAIEVLDAQVVQVDEGFGTTLVAPPERAEAGDSEEQ